MVFTPQKEKTKKQKLLKLAEIAFHLVLIILIPVIYLEITTGFDKYVLPDFITYVYMYWMLYLIIVPILYSLFKKHKKYKRFQRTKKS
ncbi:MAG: hypothetical protein COA74_13335 [Gammaproteobacteria bacterium]|nr:MAG: hypothetical protein COA74_13335 [Gammaproteobacteria bacterium]